MIYVTSRPILPDVVDYYLGLLPGVIPAHARGPLLQPGAPRQHAAAAVAEDSRAAAPPGPDPRLIPDKDRAHLVPYNTTELERDLAIRLGIPMYGADPRHFELGNEERLPKAVRPGGRLVSPRGRGPPDPRRGDRRPPPAPGRAARGAVGDGEAQRGCVRRWQRGGEPRGSARARRRGRARRARSSGVEAMQFESARQGTTRTWRSSPSWPGSSRSGSSGEEIRSPSVQLRITPLGQLEVLSTHDQVLGGPSGQSYLGCRFPADPAYARGHHAGRGEGGAGASRGGRPRTLRLRLRGRPERRGLDALRDRAEPPEGRDDPPVPHAAVPDRRPVRPRGGDVHAAERPAEVLRRDGPSASRSCTAASRRRTSSTSWCGTASTSTRRGRPGSCSTC